MAVDPGVPPHRTNTLIDHEAVRRFGVHSEAQEQADTPQVWSALAALVARGDLTVPISEVYRFTTVEVRHAYREVGTRRVTGKRVLRIMSSSEPTPVTTSTSQKVNTPMSHHENKEEAGMPDSAAEAAKAVVRRNTEQVQGQGDFALFEELFAEDFVDHTPQPGTTADKAGVLVLYKRLRAAFPDFRPEIGWQTVDGDIVTTYKVYHGTHQGDFLGIAGTGKSIAFETVDAMRVRDGKITDHWGVANLYSVLQQLDQLPTEPNGVV